MLYGAVPVEHLSRIEEQLSLFFLFEFVHACTSSRVSERRCSFVLANLLWHVAKTVRHRCSNALMHACLQNIALVPLAPLHVFAYLSFCLLHRSVLSGEASCKADSGTTKVFPSCTRPNEAGATILSDVTTRQL